MGQNEREESGLFFAHRINVHGAVLHPRDRFLHGLMNIFSDRVSVNQRQLGVDADLQFDINPVSENPGAQRINRDHTVLAENRLGYRMQRFCVAGLVDHLV